ncbi:MAG: hypothetical protein JOS17DRAFT_365549 [Linnemannia elongata]|nr:MAG: hypothetical protein JOS17DRAFT_365549 [Linnemannia elongata]
MEGHDVMGTVTSETQVLYQSHLLMGHLNHKKNENGKGKTRATEAIEPLPLSFSASLSLLASSFCFVFIHLAVTSSLYQSHSLMNLLIISAKKKRKGKGKKESTHAEAIRPTPTPTSVMLRFSSLVLLSPSYSFPCSSREPSVPLFSHSLLSLSPLPLFFILIPFSYSLNFPSLPSRVIFIYSTLTFVYGKQQQ